MIGAMLIFALQVVGRLKTETWTDKVTNQPRKNVKVVADYLNRVQSFGQVRRHHQNSLYSGRVTTITRKTATLESGLHSLNAWAKKDVLCPPI